MHTFPDLLKTLAVKMGGGIIEAEFRGLQAGDRGFESPHVHQSFLFSSSVVRLRTKAGAQEQLEQQDLGGWGGPVVQRGGQAGHLVGALKGV